MTEVMSRKSPENNTWKKSRYVLVHCTLYKVMYYVS